MAGHWNTTKDSTVGMVPTLYWWYKVYEKSESLHSKTRKPPESNNPQVFKSSRKESVNKPIAGQLACAVVGMIIGTWRTQAHTHF